MFYENESIALFVDGPNLFFTSNALGFDVDFKLLLDMFQTKGRLVRASYFTTLADTDDHVAIRPLVDWMQYNGWNVVTKPAKVFEGEDGRRRIRGNTDIELAVEAMKLAPSIDHAVLFTGNRDFTPLVAYLQDCGTRVTVASSIRSKPVMMSDDLRRQADVFIELDTLREVVARKPRDGATV